jgi:NRAMP (natural resistance-associated macrophage protein)-like metal ion transporter
MAAKRTLHKRENNRTGSVQWWLKLLGPGLVTGAADDDPSGIATYSQAGAQFGYGLLWIMPFSIPLMAAIQEISARCGRVTGCGIASNIRLHYSRWVLHPVVFLLVLANTINLGADVGAMGDALALVVGGSALLYAIIFAGGSLFLEVFVQYRRYAKYLKWLTLVLFSYVATVFMIHVPWAKALKGTFLPSVSFSSDYWAMLIAIFGTTISPYLFFWQASQETEDLRLDRNKHALRTKPEQAPAELARIRADTYIGMSISNVIGYFIILSAAATLHAHGIRDVETSSQAAKAIEPLAGRFTTVVFALGIVGTGLLAVPVLAGSAAYAVGETMRWRTGLAHKPGDAKRFYAVIAAATVLGLAINFPLVQRITHLTPIKALFWSAVVNGVAAVPIMCVLMHMGRNPNVMGKSLIVPGWLGALGWLATIVMAAATIGMFLNWQTG